MKKLSKVLNTIEKYIMENGAFAPKKQMLHFPNIFKNVIFHRGQKELIWSKGLRQILYISVGHRMVCGL